MIPAKAARLRVSIVPALQADGTWASHLLNLASVGGGSRCTPVSISVGSELFPHWRSGKVADRSFHSILKWRTLEFRGLKELQRGRERVSIASEGIQSGRIYTSNIGTKLGDGSGGPEVGRIGAGSFGLARRSEFEKRSIHASIRRNERESTTEMGARFRPVVGAMTASVDVS
jgi:hypothetical protein